MLLCASSLCTSCLDERQPVFQERREATGQVEALFEQVELQQVLPGDHTADEVMIGFEHGGQVLIGILFQALEATRPHDRRWAVAMFAPAFRPLQRRPGGQDNFRFGELKVHVQEGLREWGVAHVVDVLRQLAKVKILDGLVALRGVGEHALDNFGQKLRELVFSGMLVCRSPCVLVVVSVQAQLFQGNYQTMCASGPHASTNHQVARGHGQLPWLPRRAIHWRQVQKLELLVVLLCTLAGFLHHRTAHLKDVEAWMLQRSVALSL
mmetsp:Transcript_54054/g.126898  ORF Transcript_54054/g.126898 Transcript_54054/m.126898 type:complete len:266 (+) Transcript_54054:179-976(+)